MSSFSQISFGLFVALAVFRYLRTVISILAYNLYQPKPVLANPTYLPRDATVVIPTTFKTPDELVNCVLQIQKCSPAAVIIVTADANVRSIVELGGLKNFGPNVTVLGVDKLNKRSQILRAMPHVSTPITILADDDVFWPKDFLKYMLAIFEDPLVGAGGPRQKVVRNEKPDMWNFLGISYLERRVWNNCATNAIDGSISTLSGRTACYRSSILKDPEFQWYFLNDSWRGKPLNSDDDKCLTRYVYSHGWKIVLQNDVRSTIYTTVEPDRKGYLGQCMRWARAHWRGNFTVMENETYWRSLRYIWGFYYIYLGQFQTPALLIDSMLFALLACGLSDSSVETSLYAYGSLALWIFFTKILKLIPHFLKYPQDMKFIPASIAFSYFHGILNVYAAFSMQQTQWSGKNLDELTKARAEKEEVIPLLKDTVFKVDGYREPTPGNLMEGDDYFSAVLTEAPPFAEPTQ